VLESLRDPLYRLATGMFWDRAEAEDATQDALIAVMTSLSSYRGDASLSTWAYRIAVRLFARRRRSTLEHAELTWEAFADDLQNGLSDEPSSQPDADLLAEEVRVGCTLAVLQCLDVVSASSTCSATCSVCQVSSPPTSSEPPTTHTVSASAASGARSGPPWNATVASSTRTPRAGAPAASSAPCKPAAWTLTGSASFNAPKTSAPASTRSSSSTTSRPCSARPAASQRPMTLERPSPS
jgi:RNA polymerase sigma factor (sigma-70 family)